MSVQFSIAPASPSTTSAGTYKIVDGDLVDAGGGNNVVFGDNGRITAANSGPTNFSALPITLGLVETIESLIGGSDEITTGVGRDIVLGGIDADTIVANFGEYGTGEGGADLDADADNIVIGDSGYIDWTAKDAGRIYADETTPLRAAVIAGILRGATEEKISIVNAARVAEQHGIRLDEDRGLARPPYSNLVSVTVYSADGGTHEVTVAATHTSMGASAV